MHRNRQRLCNSSAIRGVFLEADGNTEILVRRVAGGATVSDWLVNSDVSCACPRAYWLCDEKFCEIFRHFDH